MKTLTKWVVQTVIAFAIVWLQILAFSACMMSKQDAYRVITSVSADRAERGVAGVKK